MLAALFLKYPVNGAKKRACSGRKALKRFVHAAMEDELPFINILLILKGRLQPMLAVAYSGYSCACVAVLLFE